MSRICSFTFYLANVTAFIFAIPVLATGWLMMTNSHSHCDDHLYPQLLEIGAFLMITSLLGMIGLSYRIRCLLWIYLVLTVVRISLHIFLTALTVVSIHNQKAFSKNYSSGEEYKIEHFSGHARSYVDGIKWEARRSCIVKYNFCRGFDHYRSSKSPKDFMQEHPIMWGCCQPPESCGYRYEGDTMWLVPEEGIQSNDTDCYKYMNNKEVLCSNCDTCKAGFLAFLYGYTLRLVLANIVIIGLFLFMIVADVIAIRDIRRTEKTRAVKL